MSAPEQPRPPRTQRLLIALGIAAAIVLFVVLHLTGAIGPGSH